MVVPGGFAARGDRLLPEDKYDQEDAMSEKVAGSSSPTDRPARACKRRCLPLVFIDPTPLTRHSLSNAFAKALPEFAAVAVSSCDELLEMHGGLPSSPALVVLYIKSLQVTDAWVQSTLGLVKLHLADAPIVLLSDRDDADQVAAALAYGLRGYIATSVGVEVVCAALRLIFAGGTFIPADAFREVTANSNISSHCMMQRELLNDLTPRELSVLELLRAGAPNKVIAIKLQMQASTVKVHVRSIMKKLGVTNRTHAASIVNRLFGEHALAAPDKLPQ
jgi:DNA-binding NarL/FixJ family response regulator